jgi:CheY-like chemotaxis protein
VGDLETHSGAAQVTEHRPLRRVYRLLVVDDNEVNLEYMAVILSNAGHRALTAANGAEALRRLEEMPPDAAILDIQMPGMSGIDLGRKVRDYTGGRYDPNLPLVALTAFDSEEVGRSGIDFDGVFDKPVDVPKLLSFLDAVVDLRESPSASVFAAHWAGRSAEGERSLAAALEEIPGLVARMKDAIAAADLEAMRPAARAMGAQLRLLGDERGAAAYRRLALAVSDEDGAVIACRADRLASNCALELEMLKTLFNG